MNRTIKHLIFLLFFCFNFTLLLTPVITYSILKQNIKPEDVEWTEFQANSQHTGFVPVTLVTKKITLAWKKDLSEEAISGLVLANNSIYFTIDEDRGDGSNTLLLALSQDDGSTLWKADVSKHAVSRSHPSYSNGKLFFYDINGSVQVYNAKTGAEISIYKNDYLNDRLKAGVMSYPTCDGCMVYFYAALSSKLFNISVA